MAEKVIPPWKKGSTVVEETKPKTQAEHIKSVAHLGGLASQRNRRLRANGFTVKSAFQIKEERKLLPKKPGVAGNPDPNSKTSTRVARMTEDNLTDAMRDRADKFAREYIRDFNCVNAWLRIGGNPNTPTTAREMLRWPYVQQKLAEFADMLSVEDVIKPTEVALMLKREANDFSESASHSARVAAAGKLSRILRMDVQVTEGTVEHRGGVMVVPAAPNMKDWQADTIEGQAKLKTEVTK